MENQNMSDDLIFNHKNEYQKKGTTMIPFNEKINPIIEAIKIIK